MTTLAVQIYDDLHILVSVQTLLQLSRQRNPAATTEDTVLTTRVTEMAAAKIKSYLGDVDGSDDQAVEIGVRLCLVMLSNKYSLANLSGIVPEYEAIKTELQDLSMARKQAISPQSASPDNDYINSIYPEGQALADDDDE